MIMLIKKKGLILCAALFFFMGLASFSIQQANANNINEMTGDNPCYHCESIESCEEGGQPSGYTDCEIDHGQIGTPDGCQVEQIYCEHP